MSFAACGVATAWLLSNSLFGYALIGGANGPRWKQPVVNFELQFPAPPSVLLDGSVDYYKSFENALMLWNEQLRDLRFTWNENGNPRDGDGITQASIQNTIYGSSFGSSTLAVTLIGHRDPADSTRYVEADIVFNGNRTFNSYRGLYGGGTDFHRVALHELGHVLGLDHPDENGQKDVEAIMNSTTTKFDHLMPDDIAGAQSLYGRPANAPDAVGNGHVANISTRVQVGTGAHVMIGGFIIQNATKPVLIRAIGPSLAASGVNGTLPDPALELHNGAGDLIGYNDNWKDNSAQAQLISSTGAAPSNDKESAIYANLAPGNYTAIVSGTNSSTGVGLVEVYDLAQTTGKIVNISTRGQIGTDENVLIGGFILTGPQAVRVVVRAIGPSLAGAIPDALRDPTLELHDSNGATLQSNDNWADADLASQGYPISGVGLNPSDSRESALQAYLAPGNFTAIVRGKNNSTGVGLVEVYDIGPPD